MLRNFQMKGRKGTERKEMLYLMKHSTHFKPKDKYVCISMKEIWRNLDGPPKNKELWSYLVSFEFSSKLDGKW